MIASQFGITGNLTINFASTFDKANLDGLNDEIKISTNFVTKAGEAQVAPVDVAMPIAGGTPPSSDIVIEKVIFDEGAETFEIIPVSPGQFSGFPYDWTGMTLTDGTTTLTFDSFLEQGPSGGAQVVNGNLVFNIMNSEIAALKTMLEDGTPDGIVITSAFSAGQTQLVAETQANSPLPVQLPSISVKEVMFDAGYGSIELIVDVATKFTGTPAIDDFDWSELSISINNTPAPLTAAHIESIMVTTGGSFDGNLMINLKSSYDTTNLDGTDDIASIGADFVKNTSGLTPVEALTSPKNIMLFDAGLPTSLPN